MNSGTVGRHVDSAGHATSEGVPGARRGGLALSVVRTAVGWPDRLLQREAGPASGRIADVRNIYLMLHINDTVMDASEGVRDREIPQCGNRRMG